MGGRGINVRILYDEVRPGTDGLDPKNVLIFGTGPVTGTPVASGRLNITAMSPLTNILGDSNAGSHFSPEVKFAGFDQIIISGKPDKPVYLFIEDGKAEIRDAKHLWNKTTFETEELLKTELNDNKIVEISCLANLKNLEVLNLDSNQIETISGLEKLENLKGLNLAFNKIKKISL